jgi:hypothetical protein
MRLRGARKAAGRKTMLRTWRLTIVMLAASVGPQVNRLGRAHGFGLPKSWLLWHRMSPS